MRSDDSTIPETIETAESVHDMPHDFTRLEHLAEQTDDPALKSRLETSLARKRESSRGFLDAWERAWVFLRFGR